MSNLILAYPYPDDAPVYEADSVLVIGVDITEARAWRAVYDGHARYTETPPPDGYLTITDNGDGTYAVAAVGTAMVTDNGNGTVTLNGASTAIASNTDQTATVAA